MATPSNILDWKIPWTEEFGGLESMGSQKESDTTEQPNISSHSLAYEVTQPIKTIHTITCFSLNLSAKRHQNPKLH